MAASLTTSLGRQFQSFIVLGRKEELLCGVLAACRDLGAGRGEGGGSFDLRPGQWARLLWILYGMESLEI